MWHKFVNLPMAFTDNIGDNDPRIHDAFAQLPLEQLGGSGGFLSNIDNAYLSAAINRRYGDVLVTRFRAPTFTDTRGGTPTMPTAQLRYWSICMNETFSQRFVQCANDDRATVGPDGYVTFVVTAADQKPSAAVLGACSATWLPWGPQSHGTLIYRNMLPTGFPQAIQFARHDHEAQDMGDYMPVSHYTSNATFEQTCG